MFLASTKTNLIVTDCPPLFSLGIILTSARPHYLLAHKKKLGLFVILVFILINYRYLAFLTVLFSYARRF